MKKLSYYYQNIWGKGVTLRKDNTNKQLSNLSKARGKGKASDELRLNENRKMAHVEKGQE